MTMTMLSNIVIPQISFVQKVVVAEAKRFGLRNFVKTQSALDRLYKPPPWQIERSQQCQGAASPSTAGAIPSGP